jgi:soluble lytic murein transglycosylase
MKPSTILYIASALLLAAQGPASASERERFLAAEALLARGEMAGYERLAGELRDYPLYPYLRFEALRRRLGAASDEEVRRFLQAHGDTPLAGRVRRARLERLAEQGRWEAYAELYAPDDSTERLCHYLGALLHLGRAAQAFARAEDIWLSGESRPAACDPLLDAWREAGHLTPVLAWRRVALAMGRGNTRLAAYLRRFLPDEDRPWLDLWLAVHRDPERVADPQALAPRHPRREAILGHGLVRLADRSPQTAAAAWDLLRGRYPFSAATAERVSAAIGLALAEQGMRRGLRYLERIPARADNQELQDRRLRAALRLGAWPQVGAWVASMPEGEHRSEQWLYWQGRAMEAQGQGAAARRLYRKAAGERSLWGFLAAERVGAAYALGDRPAPVSDERLARVGQGPAGRRIAELMALGRGLDVRRELHALTRTMGRDDLMAAAVLAGAWGMPDQAAFLLARSGFWDDLGLRFPLAHEELVRREAQAAGLDASWVFAVLRQESAFNPQAVSPAGAVGLMQLMPATARAVAASRAEAPPGRAQLLEPALNIRLGTTYLAQMQERFDDHPVLAAAAYNAGPGRVAQWSAGEPVEADVWTATIPFRETRHYVRRVLAYRLIYDYRLGQAIRPLSEIMRPVGGAGVPGERVSRSDGEGSAGVD